MATLISRFHITARPQDHSRFYETMARPRISGWGSPKSSDIPFRLAAAPSRREISTATMTKISLCAPWQSSSRSFPLAGAVGFKVLQSLNVDLGLERLTSTANTHEVAWATLLQSGLSSPIVGVGIRSAGDTENSYLLAFAGYGIGMVALLGLLMFACMIQSIRLFRRRWALPPIDRTLIDLIIGVEVMYFAGAVFEGYIMARVGPPLMFMLIFSSMGTALISVLDGRSQFDWQPEWDENPDPWEEDEEQAALDDYAQAV